MIDMDRLGKRIHRVSISLDDETLLLATHLANYDDRSLAEYLSKIIVERIHGVRVTIPTGDGVQQKNRRCD